MNGKLSLRYSMEWILLLCTLVGLLATLQTFLIGEHFVIPTGTLALTILLGNLAWFGFRDMGWVKYLLFWVAVLIAAHVFFALFWAKTPRAMLGDFFLPVYGLSFVLFTAIALTYQQRNGLYRKTQA